MKQGDLSDPPAEGATEDSPRNWPGTGVHSTETPAPIALPAREPPERPAAVSPITRPPAADAAESFWGRIRRHKVVEWSLAYVAFGYAALHGVVMLRET